MFCRECGESIEDGSKFCRHCGTAQTGHPARSRVAAQEATADPPDPYVAPLAKKPMSTANKVGIGVIVLLVIVAIFHASSPTPTPAPTQASSADQSADLNAAANDAVAEVNAEVATQAPAASAEAANWDYSTKTDKVRGGTSYSATTTSTNTIHQDPPYDSDTSMTLTVRHAPSSGLNIILRISSGQFMCPSYEGCSGTARFDDGSAERIRFTGPDDDSSETIFVEGEKSFLAKLKRSKRLIIEKTLYQAGAPQFEFDVHGLKWDH